MTLISQTREFRRCNVLLPACPFWWQPAHSNTEEMLEFSTSVSALYQVSTHTHTHTHTFNGPFSGTTRVSWYYKGGKTNLDFTEARDSEWQWHQLGICKSAPRSREITTPAPHHLIFYRPDALPAAQPTASKHWRQQCIRSVLKYYLVSLTQPCHTIPYRILH